MRKLEGHSTEYKRSWHDDHLDTICAFANKDGGTIYIGKDNNGNTYGIDNPKKMMEDIPSKIVNMFGFIPDVKLGKEKNKAFLVIKIKPQQAAIAIRGRYYTRSGSTTQELRGAQLHKFLLDKGGISWESILEEGATLKDIDVSTIAHFKELALKRFPIASKEKSVSGLLEKLKLLKKGKLTRAAVLLFAKDPQQFHIGSGIRIGRFKDDATLLSMDEVNGNLFQQVEGTMEILQKKYLHAEVTFEGLNRKEDLEYPEEALREAIVNAIVHRDYFSINTQLKVYSDQLSIWNNGELVGLTIEELRKKHRSHARNELIADVFHKAGFIEKWGTGTVKMISECKSVGLPEPIYEEAQGGMQVTFLKNIYTEEYLKKAELNERQIKAMLYVKEYGSITNNTYQIVTKTIKRTATRDLAELLKKKLLKKIGITGKGTTYTLWGHKGDKGDIKMSGHRGDALDKKISLLEKDLNTIDPDETVQDEFSELNERVFFRIFNSWLTELAGKLIPIAQKFNRLFRETNHHIFVVSGIGQAKFTNENPKSIIHALRLDCEKHKNNIRGKVDFELSFWYGKLRQGGLKSFAFNHTLKIEFDDIKYKVFMDEFADGNGRNHVLQFDERLLHKQVTKKEMDDLAKKMGKTLLEEIDYYTKQHGIR